MTVISFRTFSSPSPPKKPCTLSSQVPTFLLPPWSWAASTFYRALPIWGIWYVDGIRQYVVFCDELLRLSILLSRVIHTERDQYFSPFFSWVIVHPVDRLHFVIHLSLDGRLSCFHFLVVMKNAAINIPVQVLCSHTFLFFLGIYIGVELLGDVVTMFSSLSNCWTVFQSSSAFSRQRWWGLCFLHTLAIACVFLRRAS